MTLCPGTMGERSDRYRVGLGYSQPVINDLVIVADVYGETARRLGDVTNMAEIGARYQLTPQTVVSGSFGVGFANSSETFRAVLGIQHTLSFPY
jgi:hypothetical protein